MRPGRAGWAILAAALAVRLAAAAAGHPYAPHPGTDPADYADMARAIAAGHWPGRPAGLPGPTAYRPPLYPLFLGGAFATAPGDPVVWARTLGALAGTVTVWLTGVLALALLGRRRVALAAMAVAALWPPMWILDGALLSEVLFVPLVLGAVACVLAWRREPRPAALAAAGVLSGLATLTRVNGAALLVPFAVAVWPRGARGARAALPAAALVALAALTVAPWTIRNALTLHRFVPVTTEDGYTLAGTYNAVARRQERFPAAWVAWYTVPRNQRLVAAAPNTEAAWSDARAHPAYVAKAAWWNLRRVFDAAGLDWVRFEMAADGLPRAFAALELGGFLALAPLAALGLWRRPPPAWLWLVGAALLAPVLATGYLRFRAPLDPLLAIAAVAALSRWPRAARGPRRERRSWREPRRRRRCPPAPRSAA